MLSVQAMANHNKNTRFIEAHAPHMSPSMVFQSNELQTEPLIDKRFIRYIHNSRFLCN
jgi:hypothetical protein